MIEMLATGMRPYPGRWNITLRTLLAAAIRIVSSMMLQVPFLGAISLFVVFYATQANIVMARLVGLLSCCCASRGCATRPLSTNARGIGRRPRR
ncbi:MAG TPA: hypothetical protein VF265_09010 [Nevskiaceae bacterium]